MKGRVPFGRWFAPCLLVLCCAARAEGGDALVPPGDMAPTVVLPQEERALPPAPPLIEEEPVADSGEAPPPEREIARGVASWYGGRFHGRLTASGEPFDMNALTAAHPTLPFGTMVQVRSLVNGRTVEVRINDRGPYVGRRIIDLSRAAAAVLGLIQSGAGTKPVLLSVLEDSRDARVPKRLRREVSARRSSPPGGH